MSARLVRRAPRLGIAAGRLDTVGIEGTGSQGAGLRRWLMTRDVAVVEVDRPDRRLRRTRGKSDPIDAEPAARKVLSGEATATPKSQDGNVSAWRVGCSGPTRSGKRGPILSPGGLHAQWAHSMMLRRRVVQSAVATTPTTPAWTLPTSEGCSPMCAPTKSYATGC